LDSTRGFLNTRHIETLESRTLFSALAQSSEEISFRPAGMIADPIRNVVYVLDTTQKRVLAIDTDLGQTITSSPLADSGEVTAISPSADRLYVAENATIQVFSLPDLKSLKVLPIAGTPFNLAAGVDDHLFYSAGEYFSQLTYEIDAATGDQIGDAFGNIFAEKLQTNRDGTKLYIGASESASEYLITGDQPVFNKSYSLPDGNGVSGPPYLRGAAPSHDGTAVFFPATNVIQELRVSDGMPINNYPIRDPGHVGEFDKTFMVLSDQLVITPNDHVVYAVENFGDGYRWHYYLGIIGCDSLNIPANDSAPLIPAMGKKLPSTRVAGTNTQLPVTLKNPGSLPFSGKPSITIFASRDEVYDGFDVLLGYAGKTVRIKPGKIATFSASVSIPEYLQWNYYLISIVNADGTSSQNVDLAPTQIELVAPRTNLTASLSPISGEYLSRQPLSTVLTIRNTGNMRFHQKVTVELFGDRGELDVDYSSYLRPVTLNLNLKPGQSTSVRFDFDLPVGSWNLYGVIDPQGDLYESNTDDNVASQRVLISQVFNVD